MRLYKRIIEKLYYKCFPEQKLDISKPIPLIYKHVELTTIIIEDNIPTFIINQDPEFIYNRMLDGMRTQLKQHINIRLYEDPITKNTTVRGELKVLPLDRTIKRTLFNSRDPDGIY